MSYIFVGFRVPGLKAAPTILQGEEHAPVQPFGPCCARKGLKHPSCPPLAVLFLPGRRVWFLEPWLTRTSCLALSLSSSSSGEAETNPYLLGETDPAPLGSGEAKTIPQPSGETKPALKASGETETSPKFLGRGRATSEALGETEINPRPSGETEPTPKASSEVEPSSCYPSKG